MTRRLRKPIRRTISVLTAVLAGISVFQIVPIEAEENSFEATVEEDNGKLEVKASAPSGTLPEDAKLVVTPIKNDGNDSLYGDTWNRLNAEAQKENKAIDAFIAYDIQFEKDDKATEPVDGNVNVDLKWDTPVKPDGVQDGDQISVIHLKNDETAEDLSKETDTTKNHATSETDENDPLSLKGVTIQSDSFSVYTVVWSRDLTPAPETTESAAPAATEATPADDTEVQLPTAENDEYSVNVSYNRSEVTNIPEDAYVTVESYADDSAEYNTAREAVIAQKQEDDSDFDASSLGMKAFDISIHSPASPDEIEPDGKVSVSIKLKKLPEEVQEGDSLNIQHIVSQDPVEPAQTETDPSQVKAETVATDVKAEDGAVASFETESFSTYSVTWKSGDNANFANNDNSPRELNGRTVAIVWTDSNGKKYALANQLVNSDKKVNYTDPNINETHEVGNLQLVPVEVTNDNVEVKDNYKDSIFWRFSRRKDDKGVSQGFFIENVDKGGASRDDKDHLNENKYLRIANINDTTKDIVDEGENTNSERKLFVDYVPSNNDARNAQCARFYVEQIKNADTGLVTGYDIYVQDKYQNNQNTHFYLNVDDGKNTNGAKGVHLYTKAQNSINNNDSFMLYGVLPEQTEAQKNERLTSYSKDQTIDTISKGINIKMFDYAGQMSGDNFRGSRADAWIQNQYFNKDETQNFKQGMVEDQLIKDTDDQKYYPALKNEYASNCTGDYKSLKPLFNRDDTLNNKDTNQKNVEEYDNVNHLFLKSTYDETGYYVYNCFKNYAYLNKEADPTTNEHNFTVYDNMGTSVTAGFTDDDANDFSANQRGNFFPFNPIKDETTENDGSISTFTNQYDEEDRHLLDTVNGEPNGEPNSEKNRKLYKTQDNTDYYFGMTMEMKFYQPKDGMVTFKGTKNPMIYDFNGDDDLWVYVDNVLLLDIGGIHGAVHGSINFATGVITYYNSDGHDDNFSKDVKKDEKTGYHIAYIGNLFEKAQKDKFVASDFNTDGSGNYTSFKDYTTHTLNMFYMERGANASDLHMRFNLQSITDSEFQVTKNITNSDANRYADEEFQFQAYYSDNGTDPYTLITPSQYNATNWNGLKKPYYDDGTQLFDAGNTDGIFKLKPGQKAHFPVPHENGYYRVQEVNIDPDKYQCTEINGTTATMDTSAGDNVVSYTSQNMQVAPNPQVTFTNEGYEQTVNLVKKDSSGNKNLSGATFKLYKGADKTGADISKTYLKSEGSDDNGIFSNGTDGNITLPPGTYTLQETKAPDGYNRSTHTWTFTVKKDDSTTNGVTLISGESDAEVDKDNNSVYTITIKNTPGTTLPNTGGKGIWIYIFGGSILMLFSAYMLYRKHKRKDAYMHLES